eukprot:TRINITY_DN15905_c0_g1_i1.p1 TRINITY_DN15905_c0_g1~~TRINITY_DN15905_c0_g1_i1.p1  ORF type:complete len:157 (-),score=24.72 TRINITY_DN15905_c0_g1_i1:50-520(-)
MIWQCWLARAFSSTRAQEDSCPTTLHINTDCSIVKAFSSKEVWTEGTGKILLQNAVTDQGEHPRPGILLMTRSCVCQTVACFMCKNKVEVKLKIKHQKAPLYSGIHPQIFYQLHKILPLLLKQQSYKVHQQKNLKVTRKGLRRSVSFSGKSLCYKY